MKKISVFVILGSILLISSVVWAKSINYTGIRIDQIRINPATGIVNVDYTWIGDEERKGSVTLNDLQGIDPVKLGNMGINYLRLEKYIRNFLKWKDIDEKGIPDWVINIKPLVTAEEAAEVTPK
jgi:hypothetical protein